MATSFQTKPNAWFISRPLHMCNSLFGDTYEADVHAFVCRCGASQIRIAPKNASQPYHICDACGNNRFLHPSVRHRDALEAYIDTVKTTLRGQHIHILFAYRVPEKIDLAADNVRFATRHVCRIVWHKTKRRFRIYRYHTFSRELETLLRRYAIKHIAHHYGISPSTAHDTACRLLYPAMQKHHRMDDTLYDAWLQEKNRNDDTWWRVLRNGKEQKSLKRALFLRYAQEQAEGFDALTPFVLFRTVDNIDTLRTLLQTHSLHLWRPPSCETMLFSDKTQRYIAAYMIALLKHLRRIYAPPALIRLFRHIDTAPAYWEDALWMYAHLQEAHRLSLWQPPRKLTLESLHRSLAGADRVRKRRIVFAYTKEAYAAQTTVMGYTFRLPDNNRTLSRWSLWLNNCLYGYDERIASGRSLVYGIFHKERLRYALEIRNGAIAQLYGKHNTSVPDDVQRAVEHWFSHHIASHTPSASAATHPPQDGHA